VLPVIREAVAVARAVLDPMVAIQVLLLVDREHNLLSLEQQLIMLVEVVDLFIMELEEMVDKVGVVVELAQEAPELAGLLPQQQTENLQKVEEEEVLIQALQVMVVPES